MGQGYQCLGREVLLKGRVIDLEEMLYPSPKAMLVFCLGMEEGEVGEVATEVHATSVP